MNIIKPSTLPVVAGLFLAACSPPPESVSLAPPPSTQFAPDAAQAATREDKALDVDKDGKVTAGEAVGMVVVGAAFVAICPFCLLGM